MASVDDSQESLSGTLERGLAILRFFAVTGEATPAAVAEAIGLSRSAAYRILSTLKEQDFLEVNPASEKLRLGVKAAELGMAALSKIDVVRLAPTYLQDLAKAASETVFLAVINNDEVVYVYKEEGPRPIRMVSQVGSRRPLHSTALGKAYISALPLEARRSLVDRLDLRRFMPNTITNPAAFDDEIALTRERGYAVDNVEVEEGVACVGAPVFDFRGLPVAAISVAGPADRVFPRAEQLGPVVAKTASEISRRLGYLESAGKDV